MGYFKMLVIVGSVFLLCCTEIHQCLSRNRISSPRTCKEAQLCCPGQNNTCFVFGPIVHRSDSTGKCYCDANCMIMRDCCIDYFDVCKAQDCMVVEWGQWSECNNPCGYGKRLRFRKVSTYAENGGRHCPALKQRRACIGFDDELCAQLNVAHRKEELHERANILPLEFGIYRTMKKYDPWKGILKNLYERYFNEIFTRATYCGHFLVRSTNNHCQNSDWAKKIHVNDTVCVECQPVAMNREIGMRCAGHGVFRHDTQWKAVDVHKCHGQWQLIQPHQPCTCDANHQSSFIFL